MSFTNKFAQKIESSKRKDVFLIRGEDNGLECWHYVLVESLKLPILRAKIRQLPCNIDVADYGKIIKSGWGENPSDEVKAKIEAGDFEFAAPSDGYEIFHVSPTTPSGEKFFAFIAVPEPLAEKFNYLMNKQDTNMDLHQWGKVLQWGWGEAGEDDLKNILERFSAKQLA